MEENPAIVVVSLVLIALTAVIFTLSAPRLDGIPQPPRLPFLGHTIEFVTNFDTMQDLMTKYSQHFKRTWGLGILRVGLMTNGALVLVTPEAVKHVLKDNFSNYVKGHQLNGLLGDFLGDGIFTSDGARWKMHRKVATQMFSKKLLLQGSNVAFRQARKLCEKVASFAESGKSFDLQKMFYNFTMDTFCYIAFGVDLDSQNNENSFSLAFDSVQSISNHRAQFMFWKIRRFLSFPEERKLASGVREMHAFAKRIISAKRRKLASSGNLLGLDLISRFLVRAKKNNTEVTDKELIDLVLNFIIAGRDTTAAALSWTMYELMTQENGTKIMGHVISEVEDRVRRVTEGGGDTMRSHRIDDIGEDKAFEIIYGKLPYTKAVIMEGLRLHPSVPKDIKFAVKDDVLPDGTKVRAGMAVNYVPYAMGRDPSLWKDPLTFDPTRWIRTSSKDESTKDVSSSSLFSIQKSDYTYPVFNAGPRVCIGRPLALLEMQLMLAVLVPKFVFVPDGTLDGSYSQTIVPPLKHGLRLRAKPRI